MYEIKYSEQTVALAIKEMANRLKEDGVFTEDSVFLIMLGGGLWFATHLFDNWGRMNNEVYFLKGHSYNACNRQQFTWDYMPDVDFTGRHLVVLDDICDSGATVRHIYDLLRDKAASVRFVTLLERMPSRLPQEIKLYSCIRDDSTDFFVGCGLDDNDKGRMLPYVGIVPKTI